MLEPRGSSCVACISLNCHESNLASDSQCWHTCRGATRARECSPHSSRVFATPQPTPPSPTPHQRDNLSTARPLAAATCP
eukprot:760606-Prymnesium_polylepis.1